MGTRADEINETATREIESARAREQVSIESQHAPLSANADPARKINEYGLLLAPAVAKIAKASVYNAGRC